MVLDKIDQFGKAGWLTVTVLTFWFWWPVGLMLLAYLAGSGRLSTFRTGRCGPGTWFNLGTRRDRTGNDWFRPGPASSGNNAFDDYRAETLRRLEDEEREFQAFLERLRRARDKSEFDAFMTERRNRPATLDEAPKPSV